MISIHICISMVGGISCGDYNANLHNFQFMWCYVLIPNDFETVT